MRCGFHTGRVQSSKNKRARVHVANLAAAHKPLACITRGPDTNSWAAAAAMFLVCVCYSKNELFPFRVSRKTVGPESLRWSGVRCARLSPALNMFQEHA